MIENLTHEIRSYGSLIPYWAFGIATAASFYGAMLFVGKHLSPEFKRDLGDWLNGYYESTWTSQFCRLFDFVFDEQHFSSKRLMRSSIASVTAVIVLYVLFAHVLDVLGGRTFGEINLWQVLMIGAAINLIPDYFSLIETRWLLQRFARVQSTVGQIALLGVDLVFSAGIILIGIYLYTFFFQKRIPSPIEIFALFSVFAIFFYSTFLTSAWAWIYCLSTWFVRLFTRLGLRRLLDIKGDPVRQVSLVGAGLIVLGGLALGPIIKPAKGSFVSSLDNLLCEIDLGACFHAARTTSNPNLAYVFMELACEHDSYQESCGTKIDEFFDEDSEVIVDIWKRACEGGFARGCRAYGYSYAWGLGVAPDPKRAAELYQQACEGGDFVGCNNLGSMYARGNGVAAHPERAVALYQQACEGDDMYGCENLGGMYELGSGVAADPEEAAALYRQACEGGYMLGCNSLGNMYEFGRGLVADPERAVALYQQACEGGDMLGCNSLGAMYEAGSGIAVDLERAVALFQQACEGDDVVGCRNLGTMYELGRGVVADPERAVALYQQSCEGGYMLGCSHLGWTYESGSGVAVDPERAAALYQQACNGGQMRACSSLGTMYEAGRGVAVDLGRAAALYQQACEADQIHGCNNLGWMYDSGRGVAVDLERAAALYQQACEGGEMRGCNNLGAMYARGRGVLADPERAAALYQQACKGGHSPACNPARSIDEPLVAD